MLVQIFPLDLTVADRWMYFPFVGLLGMIGVGIQILLFSPKLYIALFKMPEKASMHAVWAGVILILLLSGRTIVRNTNFHDEKTLILHDSQIEDNFGMEDELGQTYFSEGNNQSSFNHLQKSIRLYPYTDNLLHLGNWYESQGDLQQAKEYYSKALTSAETYYAVTNSRNPKENDVAIYEKLTSVLLLLGAYDDAKKVSSQAVHYYPNISILWLDLAVSENRLHHWQETNKAIQKAKSLPPQLPSDLTDLLFMTSRSRIEIPSSTIFQITLYISKPTVN